MKTLNASQLPSTELETIITYTLQAENGEEYYIEYSPTKKILIGEIINWCEESQQYEKIEAMDYNTTIEVIKEFNLYVTIPKVITLIDFMR